MTRQHSETSAARLHGIVPPHILDAIAKHGSASEQAAAQNALSHDASVRHQRVTTHMEAAVAAAAVARPHENRSIYTSASSTTLPGTLLRSEGQGASADVAVNEAYDGLGATFDLYWSEYNRNSIDDNGKDLTASVHYGNKYNNAFWNGTQMVFGDGDGTIFNRFTISVDVMGHELTHGVTASTAKLVYQNQPGALNESISDVFGSLVKQRLLGQSADQADWLIGAGLLAAGIKGVALRSMKAPGTAYNDPKIGKDPQPDHMSRYVNTTSDNGGVHINSGIPNKAFYLAAIGLSGFAWERAGQIWYRTLLDARLKSTAAFLDFASLTADNATRLYGPDAGTIVANAWRDVGVMVPGILLPMVLTFGRRSLVNVDDAAGRWQFEGGGVSQANLHVANYASTKRVTYQGTDQDGQNTAAVSTTVFFVGAHPPESITLEGAHDFNSGNQTGSVSAASATQSVYIGRSYTRNGATNVVQIG